MGQESDQSPESKPDVRAKPFIPPPVLSQPPPPPPSPLEGLPPSPPQTIPADMAGVKVNLRIADPGEKTTETEFVTFNTRMVASMIDLVVAIGLVIGLIWILPGFAFKFAYLTGVAYLISRDSLPFLGGQGVGKKAMDIKVVTMDGKSLVGNWKAALIRNGVLVIPLFALVELYILLTREDTPARGRRLGDEWAKTKLIVEKKPVESEGGD
jgi:uncharacterized RDD family membrane protein YckC